MTLAEKIVAALIMKDETIAALEAEIETLKAEAQELEKVRDYFDADVPASVEVVTVEPGAAIAEKPPDPALVPIQIDVPVSI